MYIAIEGLDGSGNGTLLAKLRELFPDAVYVREPGGTTTAEKIRNLILFNDEPLAPDTEAMLYMAARQELLTKVVRPALNRGKMVISDRCYYSSLAYQGATGYANMELVTSLVNLTVRGVATPDITFYLDIPVEVSRQRVAAGGNLDTIEKRNDDFFNAARSFYLKCHRVTPNKFRLIDATQTPEAVYAEVLAILTEVGVLGAS